MGDKLQNAGKKMMPISAAFAAAGIAAGKASIDFEDAFAGVTKTVDGTDEQLASIRQGILDLSKTTASSASEIAAVAEAAGQLGIKTDDVLEFTKTMVMLGDTTNLEATEAASALAKFANITQTSSDNYSRLGSTIVELGNNFATTEADIVEMSTRLASSGTLAGLTEPQIMALATAMSSVGIEAEAGGSAMSKLIKQIQVSVETGNKSLSRFASVANMSVDEFKAAFQKDAVSALGAFISGLNDTERNGKSAIAVLDDMGLTEVRLSNTILALSASGDLLTNSINTANTAWEENTAMSKEAQKRYETTASKLKQLKATLVELGISIGDELLPYIQDAVEWLKDATEEFKDMSPQAKQLTIKIIAFGAALAPVLSGIGKISTGISALTGAMSKASPVTSKLWDLLKANPYAMVAVGAFGLVTAIKYVIENMNAETKAAQAAAKEREKAIASVESEYIATEKYADKLNDLLAIENKSSGQKQLIQTYVDKLNSSVEGLNLTYDEEADKLNMSTEAIYNKIEAMKQEAVSAAYIEQSKKAYEDYAAKQLEIAEKQEELAEAEEKIANIRKKGASATTAELKQLANLETQSESLKTKIEDLTTASEEYQSEGDKLIRLSELQSQAFQDLLTQAGYTAETLPGTVTKGLQNGAYQIPTTVQQLNDLIKFDEAVQNAGMSGEDVVSQLATQLYNGEINIDTAISRLNASAEAEFNKLPSKTGATGSKATKELSKGMAKNIDAVATVANQIKTTAEKASETSLYKQGNDAGQGFVDGLNAVMGEVKRVAGNLASIAIQAAAKAQDSHSPSKRWEKEIGYMAGEGMAIGLAKSERLVERSAANLADMAIGSTQIQPFIGGTITERVVRELDYQQVYTAFNRALAEMNLAIVMDNREVGRALRGQGVQFK